MYFSKYVDNYKVDICMSRMFREHVFGLWSICVKVSLPPESVTAGQTDARQSDAYVLLCSSVYFNI